MRHEKHVSFELEGAHVRARPNLQTFRPDPLDRTADQGADPQDHLGEVAVHAPDLEGTVVGQADRIPRSPVQIATRGREEATLNPGQIHRGEPGSVPCSLLIYQIL